MENQGDGRTRNKELHDPTSRLARIHEAPGAARGDESVAALVADVWQDFARCAVTATEDR